MQRTIGAAGVAGALVLAGGCAQILGLEPWKDPIGTGPGGGGAGGATTTTAITGGAGGAATTSSSSASSSTSGAAGGGGGSPTCFDGLANGPETDVDCGGDCAPCQAGRRCHGDADCASGTCNHAGGEGLCAAETAPNPCVLGPDPTCADCQRNGFETDVDCGGENCLPCGAGQTCLLDGDCLSTHCATGACAAGEAGRPCRADADCASGACGTGTCVTGSCCQ